MNLYELLEQVTAETATSRKKDVKTAVHTLCKALGFSGPRECPLEACQRPLPQIYRLVENALTGKGPHTIRNVKNNLSWLFRQAHARNLLPLTPASLTPRFKGRMLPSRRGGEFSQLTGYYLPLRLWPPDLQTAFTAFSTWATAPMVEGRPATMRKRRSTLETYQGQFEAFFGYLHNVKAIPHYQFDNLFDEHLIREYLSWHVNQRHQKATTTIHKFLTCLCVLTREYHPSPELHTTLVNLKRSLAAPTPVYDKADAWLPLSEIDQIGQALWPRKEPADLDSNGVVNAVRAGMSLMLRLWCRRPYRRRNICEMQLRENLYRTAEGKWSIRFAGEQLKVSRKNGRVNIFELPLPEDLIPQLDHYLNTWRPILAERSNGKYHNVFLTRYGRPYVGTTLVLSVKGATYRYSEKRFHPHMIRTVWTTEYLRSTGDFYGAAVMLNDTLETVVKNYAHISEHGIAEKTDRWLNQQFAGPPVPPKKEAA